MSDARTFIFFALPSGSAPSLKYIMEDTDRQRVNVLQFRRPRFIHEPHDVPLHQRGWNK